MYLYHNDLMNSSDSEKAEVKLTSLSFASSTWLFNFSTAISRRFSESGIIRFVSSSNCSCFGRNSSTTNSQPILGTKKKKKEKNLS